MSDYQPLENPDARDLGICGTLRILEHVGVLESHDVKNSWDSQDGQNTLNLENCRTLRLIGPVEHVGSPNNRESQNPRTCGTLTRDRGIIRTRNPSTCGTLRIPEL